MTPAEVLLRRLRDVEGLEREAVRTYGNVSFHRGQIDALHFALLLLDAEPDMPAARAVELVREKDQERA